MWSIWERRRSAFFTNVTLTNSTVYGNGANGGGNILRGGGTLTFKNNIIGGGILTGINGTGLDISGTGFSSQDYNLIQTTTGGTITGTTTHNITGVNPGLLPLGNYGGPIPVCSRLRTARPSMLVTRPWSESINAACLVLWAVSRTLAQWKRITA